MYHILFNDEINEVSCRSFIQELNDVKIIDSSEYINIYFSSTGGNVDSAIAMIDAINTHHYRGNIILSSLSVLCSAAVEIFLDTITFKRILDPNMFCMVHIGTCPIDYREMFKKESFESWNLRVLENSKKEYIAKLKSWGLTKSEITKINNGEDFWFGSEKLLKMCEKLQHKMMKIE